MAQWGSFWTANLSNAEAAFRQALVSHMITAKHAAPIMIRARRGLIVEVTENDILSAGGNPVSQAIKFAIKGLALNMAAELRAHNVAAVAVTPGYLRSESMLERFKITEATWRDRGKVDPNFLESESPLYIGRGVAALAQDPHVMARAGQLVSSWELARAYGFVDYDGRRPDWGALTIDFSRHPASLLERFRTGAQLQRECLRSVAERTDAFMAKLPNESQSAATEAAKPVQGARPKAARGVKARA
jgi:NAD(P)-dependent dehydrogenase (short-subunit alcohol dehydrogenase family)